MDLLNLLFDHFKKDTSKERFMAHSHNSHTINAQDMHVTTKISSIQLPSGKGSVAPRICVEGLGLREVDRPKQGIVHGGGETNVCDDG